MSGNRIGGLKAAQANKARHGEDFYQRLGAKGGAAGTTGGFAANPELARIVGAKGGRISKRRKAEVGTEWKSNAQLKEVGSGSSTRALSTRHQPEKSGVHLDKGTGVSSVISGLSESAPRKSIVARVRSLFGAKR